MKYIVRYTLRPVYQVVENYIIVLSLLGRIQICKLYSQTDPVSEGEKVISPSKVTPTVLLSSPAPKRESGKSVEWH